MVRLTISTTFAGGFIKKKRSSCAMSNLKGLAFGILTSASFGLIPLFTLPLMAEGMLFDSILFYRFLFAALALAGIMAAKKESFHVERGEIQVFVLLGLF